MRVFSSYVGYLHPVTVTFGLNPAQIAIFRLSEASAYAVFYCFNSYISLFTKLVLRLMFNYSITYG